MLLTKFAFLLLLSTKTYANTEKHLWTKRVSHYGNYAHLLASIVMEYADNGDLFQKICTH